MTEASNAYTRTPTSKTYVNFAEKLEDYKNLARPILANLNFRFRFVQRNSLDSEPFIEIWNDTAMLIQASIVFYNGETPVMFHLCNCGQSGVEHSHQMYGRRIHERLDVYRALVDEVNILRARECVVEIHPT